MRNISRYPFQKKTGRNDVERRVHLDDDSVLIQPHDVSPVAIEYQITVGLLALTSLQSDIQS